MNKYLKHYLVAVQHPEVSGFELLDMLMARDKLLEEWASLTPQQQMQATAADQQLIAHATIVVAELSRLTELSYERQHRKPSPEQWWWYLDVLAHTPMPKVDTTAHLPIPV
jgi:hypothetical protein